MALNFGELLNKVAPPPPTPTPKKTVQPPTKQLGVVDRPYESGQLSVVSSPYQTAPLTMAPKPSTQPLSVAPTPSYTTPTVTDQPKTAEIKDVIGASPYGQAPQGIDQSLYEGLLKKSWSEEDIRELMPEKGFISAPLVMGVGTVASITGNLIEWGKVKLGKDSGIDEALKTQLIEREEFGTLDELNALKKT